MIGNYDIQLVADEHLPTLIVIACHLPEELSKNLLERTPSDITKLYFLDLGEKNIMKRLSNLEDKINNNLPLCEEDELNLGVVLLYLKNARIPRLLKSRMNRSFGCTSKNTYF